MSQILRELVTRRLYWLLAAVPAVFVVEHVSQSAGTALFLLSVAAIVPLAALPSRATESVAARTGDAVGGLLNATLGNLTELVISLTALRAGMLDLVKASIAQIQAGDEYHYTVSEVLGPVNDIREDDFRNEYETLVILVRWDSTHQNVTTGGGQKTTDEGATRPCSTPRFTGASPLCRVR